MNFSFKDLLEATDEEIKAIPNHKEWLEKCYGQDTEYLYEYGEDSIKKIISKLDVNKYEIIEYYLCDLFIYDEGYQSPNDILKLLKFLKELDFNVDDFRAYEFTTEEKKLEYTNKFIVNYFPSTLKVYDLMKNMTSPIGELRIGYKKDNKLSRPEVVYVSHKTDWRSDDNVINYCCYDPENHNPKIYGEDQLLKFDYKLLKRLQDEWDLQENLDKYKSYMKRVLKYEKV